MTTKIKIERQPISNMGGNRNKIERPRRAPAGMMLPSFDTLFEPDDENPVDALPDTGDAEQNVEQELAVTLNELLFNKKGKNDAYRVANDDEFWFAVCFQSRDQKDEFLKLAGWNELGDKYIDGLEVARKLGLAVEPIPMPKPKIARIQRKEA